MKNNYTLKTMKTGLAILAFTVSCSFVSAQETVAVNAIADNVYSAGAVTMKSALIELEGTEFKIQITVTPSSNGTGTVRTKTGTTNWGIGQTGDAVNNFQADQTDYTANIGTIEVVDFDPLLTSYTKDNIIEMSFKDVAVLNGNNKFDKFQIGVNGGAVTAFGKTNLATEVVPFNSSYTSGGGVTATLSATDVTSFEISTGQVNTASSNNWTVDTITVNYTFSTDTASVEGIDADSEVLVLYPNPVKDTVSLNIAVESVEIIDMMGRVVKTATTNSIDVSDLVSGAYILKAVSTSGDTLTKRFVK